jgi:tetratricopeptide (TPR) repeat protein
MRNLIFLIVFLLNIFRSFAQDHTSDSLLAVLKNSDSDTLSVQTLNRLSKCFFTKGDYKTSLSYAEQALEKYNSSIKKEKVSENAIRVLKREAAFALNEIGRVHFLANSDNEKALSCHGQALRIGEEIGDKLAIAVSYNNMGVLYESQSEYPRALQYYFKALQLRKAVDQAEPLNTKNKAGLSGLYNNLAVIYHNQADYERALHYNLRSLEVAKRLNELDPSEPSYKKDIGDSYINIGIIYANQSDYPKALEYYLNALKLKESTSEKRGIAICCINIGIIHSHLLDHKKAFEYYSKALAIFQETGDKKGLAFVNANLGALHSENKEYEKALRYFFKGLKIHTELKNLRAMAISMNNIANAYIFIYGRDSLKKGLHFTDDGQSFYIAHDALLDSAEGNHKRAMVLLEGLNDEYNLHSSLGGIGNVLFTRKKYSEALGYYEKAYSFAESLGAMDHKAESAKNLYETYKKLKNAAKALDWYEKATAFADSVFNEEASRKTIQAEMRHEYDKKEAIANAEQQKKDVLHREESKRQNVIIGCVCGGLVLLLIFSVSIYRGFIQKKKANIIITQQKQEVERTKHIIELQKELVEEKQKEILDSIKYAERIQRALVTNEKYIHKNISRLRNN